MDLDSKAFLFFTGRVQGSWFPTAPPIWHRALATGWVSNLWDGRVEMELQGTREAVDQMVARLYEQRFIEIEDIEIKEIPRHRGGGGSESADQTMEA